MGVLYVSGKKSPFLVGRDPASDLVLDDRYVSRKHLIFSTVRTDVAAVRILGTNGAHVGSEKKEKGCTCLIRAGDVITIGCHCIVWLGYTETCDRSFVKCQATLPVPDTEPVEIEGPPQRKVPEKPSVMLAAGPALTMAIPILLGAGRSVAILSSVFAAVWAGANVLGRISKQKTEEKRRRTTYSAYLDECEDCIRKKIRQLLVSLKAVHPPVDGYFKDGVDALILWNRGKSPGISVRTGVGKVDNPIEIIIPKDRFAQVDDSLRGLPALIRKKYEKIDHAPVMTDLIEGRITGMILRSDRDRKILSAVMLQMACAYSPGDLRIRISMCHELMHYYMWTTLLPHYMVGSTSEPGKSIFITDDVQTAYEHVSDSGVILIKQDQTDFPAAVMHFINGKDEKHISFDTVAPELAFSYAASLSRLWGHGGDEAAIPDSAPFGRLFGGRLDVLTSYRKNDITAAFAAPLGIGAGGKKVILDLHEKAAGPHGLIAGTTGSGKSELLTTLILSFAAEFPSDKLAFFLIDYKGGGMSNLFKNLPHVLGSISNLSRSESRRAMISLRSENIRRQKLFAEAGVNNINDYTRLYDSGKVDKPLPHVLVIVDEFAELKKEEPEFMDRLISISQVGRSLGIHLILATQKPSGVVDDKIRSNTAFRMALRLVDTSDSMDMLGRADAAKLDRCGRAFLQIGNSDECRQFQSGYAMCPTACDAKIRIYTDLLLGEEYDMESSPKEPISDPETWYDLALAEIIRADREFVTKRCDRLWLPMLPDVIEDETAVAVFDDPYEQRYERIGADIRQMGHIWICGRSGSGKSELLYTLLDRICGEASIYIVDFGGGRLKDFEERASCGGYITDDRPDEVIRMTGFICEHLARRRKNRNIAANPIILALDNYSDIAAASDQRFSDHLMRIMTMGKSVGIYICAASVSAPASSIGKLVDTGFYMGSESSYIVADFLGCRPGDVPYVRDTPGRGISRLDDKTLEFQAVKTAGTGGKPPPDVAAVRYPHIPEKPELEDLLRDADMKQGIPVGYELCSGKIFYIPPRGIRCVLIAGKQYCGRHTLLFNISITASRYGFDCFEADTYEQLRSIPSGCGRKKIITIESMTHLLDDFYKERRTSEEEKELASFFENPMSKQKAGDDENMTVAIVDNETAMKHGGRKIYDQITKRVFGISFGGCLDENRIFDFSYLPYTKLQMSQKRGIATILRYDEKLFFGDVICPELINVDNSRSP